MQFGARHHTNSLALRSRRLEAWPVLRLNTTPNRLNLSSLDLSTRPSFSHTPDMVNQLFPRPNMQARFLHLATVCERIRSRRTTEHIETTSTARAELHPQFRSKVGMEFLCSAPFHQDATHAKFCPVALR